VTPGLRRPSNHTSRETIALEVILPIRIAEHEVVSAVLAMFIGGVEEPAEIRTDVQHIKVIAADLVEPCGCGISVVAEAGTRDAVGHDALEAAGAIAQVAVIRIGLCGLVLLSPLDGIEGLRMRHIEWPQDQCVHQVEGDRIRPDTERQGQYGHGGKSGRFA
jgi:hypothetical protein